MNMRKIVYSIIGLLLLLSLLFFARRMYRPKEEIVVVVPPTTEPVIPPTTEPIMPPVVPPVAPTLVVPTKPGTEELMKEIYGERSGFGIDQTEVELIQKKGGAPTYGEILFDSLALVLDDAKVTQKDVFYDLGCGIGKVAVQAYLDYPFKKVVGVELSQTRYDNAVAIKNELKERGLLDKNRTLDFILGDITEVNFKDATVIYMCSTCYSEDCMSKVMKKLAQCKPGLQVITLKSLPTDCQNYGFVKVKERNLPMTWTHDGGSPVYIYKLGK